MSCRRKELLLAFAVAAAVFAPSGNALAQQQQQPSLADRETARAAMDDGDKKRDAGDLKGALKSYEAADAIMKVPTTGIEVARVQSQLGLLLEARETLARVMRIPAKPGEPAPFAAARKAADTLSNELAGRIPSLQVDVKNVEPGQTAQISIDGEQIPAAAAAAPRKVNPGTHAVLVRVGSFEKKQDVKVEERETKTITVDVKEKPPEPPKTPVTGTVEGEVSPKSSSVPKVLMFGGFGLAVVGVGVGAVTGFMSISQTSELKDQCPDNKCPPDKQADIDSATGLGNIATVAFIVGGVGAGIGVVGLVMSGGEKEKKDAPAAASALRLRPVISPAYLGVRATF